jgi:hypothetical protein
MQLRPGVRCSGSRRTATVAVVGPTTVTPEQVRVQRLLQRVRNEVGLHRTAGPPAHDLPPGSAARRGNDDSPGPAGTPPWRRPRWCDALAAAHALQPKPAHRPLDRAPRHRHAFAHQLPHQDRVAPGTHRQGRRLAHSGCVAPVRRRGDLQRCAKRLDPRANAVLVDEGVHLLWWRPSSVSRTSRDKATVVGFRRRRLRRGDRTPLVAGRCGQGVHERTTDAGPSPRRFNTCEISSRKVRRQ